MTHFFASCATHHVWRNRQFKEITYSRKISEIIQRISDRDRAWFAQHPNAQAYIRSLTPGEFWPEDVTGYTHVYVRKIGERFRLREPITSDQVAGSVRAYYWIGCDEGDVVRRACDYDEISMACRRLGGVA